MKNGAVAFPSFYSLLLRLVYGGIPVCELYTAIREP